jgi:hypothetical protein
LNLAELDNLICAALRREHAIWPSNSCDDLETMFIRRAKYHGIIALLHERIPELSAWPAHVRDTIHQHALAQACWELCHQQVLREVITTLRTRDIEPVLFKGTALAYGLYVNPVLRSRGDTDMIVAPEDWGSASETLVALGFRRNMSVSGEFVSYQDSFTKEFESGDHTIDLHRRINNSELLSHLFSYTELRGDACQLPALCKGALGVGPVHALLLACLHPATHIHNPYFVDEVVHHGDNRLIWYYDVNLMTQSLTPTQWQDFVERAAAKGLCEISLKGLERAATYFGARCPEIVWRTLAKTGEPVTIYLKASKLGQAWIDFSAISGLPNRLRFARELIFPPVAYMRAKYEQSSDAWLLWFYARRAAAGLIKRFRPGRFA